MPYVHHYRLCEYFFNKMNRMTLLRTFIGILGGLEYQTFGRQLSSEKNNRTFQANQRCSKYVTYFFQTFTPLCIWISGAWKTNVPSPHLTEQLSQQQPYIAALRANQFFFWSLGQFSSRNMVSYLEIGIKVRRST